MTDTTTTTTPENPVTDAVMKASAVEEKTTPPASADEGTLLTSGVLEGDDKVTTPEEVDTPSRIIPEEYSDFTLSNGVVLKNELIQEVKDFARKRGFTQDEAQELAELGAKHVQQMAHEQQEAVANARSEWATQSKSDKEFGGDTFTANLAVAKAGLKAYASSELQNLLSLSGLGNHPEIIRHFYRLGKSTKDDTPDSGSPVAASKGDERLNKLYPSRNKS